MNKLQDIPPPFVLNKVADTQDLHRVACRAILKELIKLKNTLEAMNLEYSDHMSNHWLRWWEYTRAIIHSGVDVRSRILDAGGSATIFSIYLSLEGCETHTVDLDPAKVAQANLIARALNLPLHNRCESMTGLSYEDHFFDYVFSISVIEHLSPEDQPVAMRELSRVLKPGGVVALTFDYGKEAADHPILSPDEVRERLVEPSGLEVLGNESFSLEFEDMGHHGLHYTFGSLFLWKPGKLVRPALKEMGFRSW